MTTVFTYMTSTGIIAEKKFTAATMGATITAAYSALGAVKILDITPYPDSFTLAAV